MKFEDFICLEAVSHELKSEDRQGIVREMIQALLDAGQLADDSIESIVKAILKREKQGSTAMGRGVAIPHAKHSSVEKTIGTVAVSRKGIDFNSLDGEPVHVFFLLVSPLDHPDSHLRALEIIARAVRKDSFCRFLKRAENAEEIKQLLVEADGDQI